MELVVVERTFEEPVDFASLQGTEEEVSWCLEAHGVTFLHTYLSADGRRMICVYEAPDAEAVRAVQRTSGVPYDCIWTGARHGGNDGA